MKILFEFDVDFMVHPIGPPTIFNCQKCAFWEILPGSLKVGACWKKSCAKCDHGRNGYFVTNGVKEVQSEA